MKFKIVLFLLGISLFGWYACTPNRGCTEATADNYDAEADEDDGTCIPAIEKFRGTYTYNRQWTDVIFEYDTADAGHIAITEKHTADNAFYMNIDQGQCITTGDIVAFDFTLESFTKVDTFSFGGYSAAFTRTYTSQGGTWLESDTVDMMFSFTTQIPIEWDNSNPPKLITVPQTYYYYCTKVQ